MGFGAIGKHNGKDIGKALFLFLFWTTRGIKKDIDNNKGARKVNVSNK
jgi:hypothetical protein